MKVSQDSLFALGWDIEGYVQLLKQRESFEKKLEDIKMRMTLPANARGTIRSDPTAFRKDFPSYVKELYSKKREAASHVLIIMISDEDVA